jgi:hypothetical protein
MYTGDIQDKFPDKSGRPLNPCLAKNAGVFMWPAEKAMAKLF